LKIDTPQYFTFFNLSNEVISTILTKTKTMDGILYLVDETNKRRYAQIDLEKHGEIWEDFIDILEATNREKESTITLEELEKELKEEGLISPI
jgi:hypothetical protein